MLVLLISNVSTIKHSNCGPSLHILTQNSCSFGKIVGIVFHYIPQFLKVIFFKDDVVREVQHQPIITAKLLKLMIIKGK